MSILKPFENINNKTVSIITGAWLLGILVVWGLYSTGDGHIFPSIPQVLEGFGDLWQQGLVTHVFSSLWLCIRAVVLSVIISLVLVYMSPVPVLAPMANFISKFRYLPLTGIAFYITILIDEGRTIQIWVLVIFMTTYLTTSLLSMLKDIKEEEFDHARSLGCTRWEVLWEVVIKGRMDYTIECVRQNFAMIWFALVTVESIMVAGGGIGFLIKNSDKFMSHGRIIALQIIILLIGIGIDRLLNTTRKLMFRYSKI